MAKREFLIRELTANEPQLRVRAQTRVLRLP